MEATSLTFTSLSLMILSVPDDLAHKAEKHVNIGRALTGLLRATSNRAARNQVFLPVELPDRLGLKRRIAAVAHEHLWAARLLRAQAPKAALPALLPAVLAFRYLRCFSYGQPNTERTTPLDQLILYGKAIRGRY